MRSKTYKLTNVPEHKAAISQNPNLWATWTDIATDPVANHHWQGMNASYNGDDTFKAIYAGTYADNPGHIYKTSDLANWTPLTTLNKNWYGVIGSTSGDVITALAYGDGIYITINGNDASPSWVRRY